MSRTALVSGQTVQVCDAPTVTDVTSSITSGPILSANDSRVYAFVFNDSTAILYLLWGTGTASASHHSAQVAPKAYFEVPNPAPVRWVGVLTGVWAAANGFAHVTEVV